MILRDLGVSSSSELCTAGEGPRPLNVDGVLLVDAPRHEDCFRLSMTDKKTDNPAICGLSPACTCTWPRSATSRRRPTCTLGGFPRECPSNPSPRVTPGQGSCSERSAASLQLSDAAPPHAHDRAQTSWSKP